MPRSQKDRFRQAAAAQARRDQAAAELAKMRNTAPKPSPNADLQQAMKAMMDRIGDLQRSTEQTGRGAAEMVQKLKRQKPPNIRTDKPLTTSLPRRKLTCPEHQVLMSFSPTDALWHCTVPDCDYIAYNVADPLGGEPRKPQVVREDLDIIVAKTEHGERTYLRAKKLGLLIDITEQCEEVTYQINQSTRQQQALVTFDMEVKTVDYR